MLRDLENLLSQVSLQFSFTFWRTSDNDFVCSVSIHPRKHTRRDACRQKMSVKSQRGLFFSSFHVFIWVSWCIIAMRRDRLNRVRQLISILSTPSTAIYHKRSTPFLYGGSFLTTRQHIHLPFIAPLPLSSCPIGRKS